MNRLSRIVSALVLCVVFCACGGSENKENPTPGPEIKPVPEVDFAWGADIGWVSEMEKAGMRFTDSKGGTEIFSVLKNLGMNSVRLRVWVNPLDANGWSGKDDVVAMAKRAASAGMAVMIDFHYSDFFADPSYQDIPSAWPGKTAMALTGNVASHTTEVLTALKEAGVTPQWIQIGNETRNGMLWPAGQLWTSSGDIAGGWNNFEALYMSGYNAAKAIFPNAAVMPHLNHAYEDNEWWFSKLKAAGGKFDMIALSHYPMSDGNGGWQALNTSAVTNIKKLAAKFGVKVVVSEFGVKQKDSQAGQCKAAFMDAVKALRLRNLQIMLAQAEHLALAVGSVLSYLSTQVNGVIWKIEAVQKEKFVGARIIKAQEEERYRISREIHDGPAQDLANLIFQTSIAEKLVDYDPDEAKHTLQELRQQMRDCLGSVREVIFDMRPMALDDLGLVPALNQLIGRLASRGTLAIDYSMDGKVYDLPKHVEIAIFRIVQEALNNICHHAEVDRAKVRLLYSKTAVSVLVEDNGKGFDPEAKPEALDENGEPLPPELAEAHNHFGLMGMEERARIIGADFKLTSAPGEGTRVHLRVPLQVPQDDTKEVKVIKTPEKKGRGK